MTEPIELYYWPSLPGRGECVRLVLEDAGVAYVDMGSRARSRTGGGDARGDDGGRAAVCASRGGDRGHA